MHPSGVPNPNLIFSLLAGAIAGGPEGGGGGGGGADGDNNEAGQGPVDAVTCPVCLKAHMPRSDSTVSGASGSADGAADGRNGSDAGGSGQGAAAGTGTGSGTGSNANENPTPSGSNSAPSHHRPGASATTTPSQSQGGKDYGALQVYVQSKCPICLEDSGPPVVALPCGHCICRDDYFRMGGSFLDEANPRDLQGAADGQGGQGQEGSGGTTASSSAQRSGSGGGAANAAASARGSGSGTTSRHGPGGGSNDGNTGRRRRRNRWTNDEEEVSDEDLDELPVDFRDFLMDQLARQMMSEFGPDGPPPGGITFPFGPFGFGGGGPPFGPPPGYYDDEDDDDDDDDDSNDSMPPLEPHGGNGNSDDEDDSSMPSLEEIAPVTSSSRARDLSEIESGEEDNGSDYDYDDDDDVSCDSMPSLCDNADSDPDDEDDSSMPPLEPIVSRSIGAAADDDSDDEDNEDDDDDMPPLELIAAAATTDKNDDDDMPPLEPIRPSNASAADGKTGTVEDVSDRRRRGVRRQRSDVGTFGTSRPPPPPSRQLPTSTSTSMSTQAAPTSPRTNGTEQASERGQKKKKERGGRRSDADRSSASNGGSGVTADENKKKNETKTTTESSSSRPEASAKNKRRGRGNKGSADAVDTTSPKAEEAKVTVAVASTPKVEGKSGLWLLVAGDNKDDDMKLWHIDVDGAVTQAASVPPSSKLVRDGKGGTFIHSPIPNNDEDESDKRWALKHISHGKGKLEKYRLLHKDAQIMSDGKGGIWAFYPSKNEEVMVLYSAKKWTRTRGGQRAIRTFPISSKLVGTDNKGGVCVHVENGDVKGKDDSSPDDVGVWRVDGKGSKLVKTPKEMDACVVDGLGAVWCLTKGNRSTKRKLVCLSFAENTYETIKPALFVRQPLLICGAKSGGVFVHCPGDGKFSSWMLKHVALNGTVLKCTDLGECPRSALIISDGADGVWILKKSRIKGAPPSLSHTSPSKPCELLCEELPFLPDEMSAQATT